MPNLFDQSNQSPRYDQSAQPGGPGHRGDVPTGGDDELAELAELDVESQQVEAILRQDSRAWAAELPPTTRVTSYAGRLPANLARSRVSSTQEVPASAPYRPAAAHRQSRFQGRPFAVYAVVLLLLIAAVAVFRLGAGGRTTPISSGPDSQQIFRYPLVTGGSDIQTLDPSLVADPASATPVGLIFPGLVTMDENGNVVPWAAAGMPTFETSSDSYTFKIQPGLEWSDGTPIDANTFAYSLNRSLSPCTQSPVAYYLFPIKDAQAFAHESCAADGQTIHGTIPTLIGDSITVPDSQTLNIKLSAPAPYFLEALTYPTGDAQPQQLISQFGEKDWTNHLTDTGGFGGNLYKVKLWDHKGNLDLVRNTSFWGTAPKLREVDFHIYISTAAEYADYLDGRLDLGFPPASQYLVSRQRSDFHQRPVLAVDYYQPNWALAPFNDVRVRQAFDLALNKLVLANQVNQGSVIPTNHIVPPGSPGYDPALVGPDGTQNESGNVARATSLMQGYAYDNCGGQLSRCPPVTLVDSNDAEVEAVDQAAVAMWRQAFPGYPIQTRFMNKSAFTSLIQSGQAPQIFGIEKLGDYPDPQDWLSLQFGTGAINNTGSVIVAAADTMMAQADQELDPGQKFALYNQAEQLLVTDVAEIPLGQQLLFSTWPHYVQGIQFSSLRIVPLTSWQQMYLGSQ